MKHFLITTLSIFLAASAFAQNTFPSTGKVGIGTTSPSALLEVRGAYSGGSGDHTNISNAQLKLHATSGYLRIPHTSAYPTISAVYNYETNKSVYWGEPSDAGKYFFRGRHLVVQQGALGIGVDNPDAKLHIQGTPWTGIKIQDVTSSGGRGIKNQYLDGNNDGWQMLFGGHYSGKPLRFSPIANGIPNPTAFTIWNNGNVGIGTEWTDAKLHVKGNAVKIENDQGGAHTWLPYINGEIYLTGDKDASGSGRIHFRTFSAAESYKDRMIITGDGNVGIGSNDPASKLEIVNHGDGAELLRLSSERPWVFRQTSTGGTSQLDLHSTVGNKFFKITSPNGGTTAHFYVSDTEGNDGISLIPEGGRVSIGSIYADEMLTVAGTIHSREVKVDIDAGAGPDYVFDTDYELESIESIESFIKSNKHLPEVPTAAEMEANGVQLGEMNMLLLKKIEELTLYTIEQEKEISQLNEEKNSLSDKLEAQSAELAAFRIEFLDRIKKLETNN